MHQIDYYPIFNILLTALLLHYRVQEIHIALEDQESNQVVEPNNFNNQSHNLSVLGHLESAVVVAIAIFIIVGFTMPYFTNIEEDYGIHWRLLLLELIFELISAICLPAYIIWKKKTMRQFLSNEINNICSNCKY